MGLRSLLLQLEEPSLGGGQGRGEVRIPLDLSELADRLAVGACVCGGGGKCGCLA